MTNHYKVFYGIYNNDLSKKRDKPTTGVITLSATDCVPTAVGTAVSYHNDILVGAKKVGVMCESFSSSLVAYIDTLDGLIENASVVLDNTMQQAEGEAVNNNYWKAKLFIALNRRTGNIYLNVQFMGGSQTFYNLRVTKIYYEK